MNQSDGGSLHYYDKGNSTCRACADRDHKMTIIMCLALGGFLLTTWGVSLLPQTRTVFGYQRRVIKENVKAVAQIFRPVVSFFQVRAAAVVRAAAGCQIQDYQLGAHWLWWSYIWLDKAALLFEHVDTSYTSPSHPPIHLPRSSSRLSTSTLSSSRLPSGGGSTSSSR